MSSQMTSESIDLSDPLRFVISCLQEDEQQIQLLLATVDWNPVVALIRRHRIGPILTRKLKKLDVLTPDDIAVELNGLYQKNVVRTLAHTLVIHRLARLYGQAGIEFMLLKGFSNRTGYENLADRHVNDLDILVRRESQIWPAIKVLQDSGMEIESWDPLSWSHPQRNEYLKREKHFRLIDSGARVHIELHFRLFNYSDSNQLHTEELWSDSELLNIAGVDVVVPDEIKQVKYLVLHGSGCAWFRLKWIVDLYFILRDQSEDELIELVNKAGQDEWLRPLLLTLLVLQSLFSLRLPLVILKSVVADSALKSMQKEVLRALHELPPSERIHEPVHVRGDALIRRVRYEIRLRSGIIPNWHFFSGHGFSPANWQVLPLPASMHFLYKGLHPAIHLYRVLSSRRWIWPSRYRFKGSQRRL